MSSNKTNRIEWIDGLKGIACLGVFLSHAICLFYPSYYFGKDCPSHLNGIEISAYNSVFRFVLEVRECVALFCLLSGLVIANKMLNMSEVKDKLAGLFVKRYLRLMLPVFPMGLIVWLMLKIGAFSNVVASEFTGSIWAGEYYARPMGLLQMLSTVVVKMWFYGDDTISTALWVMAQIFIGSIIAMILSMIYWKCGRKSLAVYLFVFLCLIPRHDYIVAFVLGVILATIVKEWSTQKGNTIIGILFIASGLFLGAYPDYTEPIGIYRYLNVGNSELIFSMGAFLIVYGIYYFVPIQTILSKKLFTYLGSICYEILIIHIPVLFSAGAGIFMVLIRNNMNYNVASVIGILASIVITLVLSHPYHVVWGKYTTIITKKIINILGC